METYGGVDVQMYIFLTLQLMGSKLSASRPGRITPRDKTAMPLPFSKATKCYQHGDYENL
jgi:hypothetical protein